MNLFAPKRLAITAIAASLFCLPATSQDLVVKANRPVATIQPHMWGIFFEDINMGADGGIYAELVKNRSFEFFKPLMGWKVQGKKVQEGDVTVLNQEKDRPSNPRFLRLKPKQTAIGDMGLLNEGFRGMGVKKGLRYDFSLQYRLAGAAKLHVLLEDSASNVLGRAELPLSASAAWATKTVSFESNASVLKARLRIWVEGDGVLDMDMVSLFPTDTWKGRPGGMRADMIQWLADMKPGFVRFPGGCIVEGYDLSNRYRWKNTIGPVDQRQLIMNRWNIEFAHRLTPDYFQSFGLGFFEYFQLAEDIGAEPLPIVNCGMACQYNSAEFASLDELDPYIQDALDLIEFANGDVSTQWGKVRADMGHPVPFNLKMMGIGNENWGPQYIERLKLFTDAILKKYPGFKIVNSSGTDPDGERFNYLDKELRNMNAAIIDEHYYRRPEWFLQNASRYDQYPREGSKIFAGEYAAQTDRGASPNNTNNWRGALAEAAFMTGLERNAGVVEMASYAPLFAHAEGWQWKPDLIWVNNLQSYGTPNYYVQKLFATNKGTHVLSILSNNEVIAGKDSIYASAALDTVAGEVVIKLVNASSRSITRSVVLDGVKKVESKGKLIQIQHEIYEAENTFEQPLNVAPAEKEIKITGKKLQFEMPARSFSVLRIKAK